MHIEQYLHSMAALNVMKQTNTNPRNSAIIFTGSTGHLRPHDAVTLTTEQATVRTRKLAKGDNRIVGLFF